MNYIINNPELWEHGFYVEDWEGNIKKELTWAPVDSSGKHYSGYENISEVKLILSLDEEVFFGKEMCIYYKKGESKREYFSLICTFEELIPDDEDSDLYLQNPIAYNLLNFIMLVVEGK